MNHNYIIDLISFDKPSSASIIGSYSDPKIKYSVDVDIQVNQKATTHSIQSSFAKLFSQIKDNELIHIIEFKCGLDKTGHKILWNQSDLDRGYTTQRGTRYDFIECLKQKSIIKLDLVVQFGKTLQEITVNYFFTLTDHENFQTAPVSETITRNLLEDALIYRDNKDILKSTKRFYSYFKYIGDESNADLFLCIINGPVGLLYKRLNLLNLIEMILKHSSKKLSHDIIDYNLDLLRKELPTELHSMINALARLSKKSLLRSIPKTKKYILHWINDQLKHK